MEGKALYNINFFILLQKARSELDIGMALKGKG